MILPTFQAIHFFPVFQDLNSAIGPAPFSYEDSATLAREACDYSIKISLDEARAGTGKIGNKSEPTNWPSELKIEKNTPLNDIAANTCTCSAE